MTRVLGPPSRQWGFAVGFNPTCPRSLLTVPASVARPMISKREAAQRLLARWLDEVASGEATMPLREFITAGQVGPPSSTCHSSHATQ